MNKDFFNLVNNVEDAYFSNNLYEINNNVNKFTNSVESMPKSFSDVIYNVYDMYFAKEKNDYARFVDDMAYEAVKGKAKEALDKIGKTINKGVKTSSKNMTKGIKTLSENMTEGVKTSGKMFELKNLGKTLIRLGKAKDNEKAAEKRENNKGEMKQGLKDLKKGVDKMIRTKKYYEDHGDKDAAKKGTKNSLKKMKKGSKETVNGLRGYLGNKAHSLNTQGKIVRASYNRLKKGEKELYFSDILKDVMLTSFNAGARNPSYNQYINDLNSRGLQTSLTQEDFSNIMSYPESRIELMHILD